MGTFGIRENAKLSVSSKRIRGESASKYVMLLYVMLRLCYSMSCYVMSCFVTARQVTLHLVTVSHYAILQYDDIMIVEG